MSWSWRARHPGRWVILAMGLVFVLGLTFVLGLVTGRATTAEHAGLAAGAPSAVDVGFCQDMTVHHEQALLMSTLAQTRAGPAVRPIADSILLGQSQEVGLLRGWLRLWGRPAASPSPMTWMHGTDSSLQHEIGGHPGVPASPAESMPGLASPEELNDLWSASGNDFDVLFLRLMTRHHQGGVGMARHAATNGGLDIVREAAKAMVVQQVSDIGEMQVLLSAIGATPLPPQ